MAQQFAAAANEDVELFQAFDVMTSREDYQPPTTETEYWEAMFDE